jgi:peptide/nickel transport system substrate-binding protein
VGFESIKGLRLLKRNTKVAGGNKVLIDMATFKYTKNGNTRSMALQNGEVDVANYISSSNIPLFDGNSKYKVYRISSLRIIMSYLNLNNEFLKDPAVRKAITMAVDRQTYANKLLNGTAVAAGPFSAALPFGGKSLKGYSFHRVALATLVFGGTWGGYNGCIHYRPAMHE